MVNGRSRRRSGQLPPCPVACDSPLCEPLSVASFSARKPPVSRRAYRLLFPPPSFSQPVAVVPTCISFVLLVHARGTVARVAG